MGAFQDSQLRHLDQALKSTAELLAKHSEADSERMKRPSNVVQGICRLSLQEDVAVGAEFQHGFPLSSPLRRAFQSTMWPFVSAAPALCLSASLAFLLPVTIFRAITRHLRPAVRSDASASPLPIVYSAMSCSKLNIGVSHVEQTLKSASVNVFACQIATIGRSGTLIL
jgi:hypothetical protein